MKRFELGRVVMTPNVARTPGASMVTTRQHTGPAVEDPAVSDLWVRNGGAVLMRTRSKLTAVTVPSNLSSNWRAAAK